MISRRSSGSIRAESAVEPTRSENITVTSAALRAIPWRCRLIGRFKCCWRRTGKLPDGREYFQSMPKGDAEFLEALICQVGLDVVFGETPRILGHAELFEPPRNLVHCGALSRAPCDAPVRDYPNRKF
jgi:hypothetical protein